MADDLFRTTSLSSKTKFEGSSRLSSDKQAVRTSTPVFDDTASKSRFASPAKAYLPVFNLVPRYDDDIFEGVPGTKTATAGTVNDDLIGVFEAAKSTAATHVGVQLGRTRGVEQTSKPSSGTGSTERRTMDVSSSASRDGLSELNSFQSSKSRWGRHHTKYERWSQQPSSAVSNDSVHKPAKMDCPDDLSVDPFNPGNRQARESTILDSLDPFNMKYYTGGRNVPVMSNPSEDTKRAKENDASIGSSQSTTMPMSSHSKPSRNSYVRKLENGNIPSSEIPRRVGALEDRSVGGQHVHGNGLTTSTFSTPVTPSTSASRKSQYNANIDSRYSSSPIKSNEFLPGKLTPRGQFNLENISKSIRQTEPRGFEEVWLTIDDFRLVTQPTSAPPPSRSPPPFGLNRKVVAPRRKSKSNQNKDFDNKMLEGEEHFSNTKVVGAFTMGRQAAKTPISGLPSFQEKEIKLSKAQLESTSCDFLVRPSEQRVASVAAASELDMKDAIKRAEALLKLGKELEEKELLAKAADDAKNEEKENVVGDAHSLRKKEPNHADAKERKAEQQGNSRHTIHEGTKNRSAFELANQEAHERASETRERAERAAVQRIAEEVRERAATEAREKVATKIKAVTEAREKAAAEARERAAAEARERAASEAGERVAAEAREKAAAEAREKAAAEEREIAQLRERGAAEAREKERAAAQAREKERAAAEARERERAATEARERERAAAEAREKEATEAREKAARELMEKLAAEAGEKAAAEEREKLVAEAREKAVAEERARMAEEAREKIAAEARVRAAAEKVAAQARARSERAAVQRANAEARERAAEKAKAEAQQRAAERAAAERAAAEARTREESAQKRRPATPDPMNASHPSKVFQNEEDRTSASGPSSMKTSQTIIPDDWMPFFVASPTTEFQEMRGELSDRRQVRLERHQRTTERMAKALAEKNQRDFEVQREQAEKQRAAEILDAEIHRWAAGKEGNLRALLSTLHYVLWPGCGWQPVSVSDLVTAAAVKKIYRKATLCVHPDKVQQKGSSVQQKYIAEKVFDLLKEAWNKFSSEGLF